MKHIDLFSGVGGFSIGFEREGFETVAFCELDAGCRAVLGRHWPRVPIYADIRDHSGLPVSGLVGSRHANRPLRLTELVDVRPDWVVVENGQHTWGKWVPELRSRLHAIGYASVPLQVSAAEVGAVHLRRRVFVVAHSDSEQLRELSRWWGRQGRQVADELAQSWDSAPRGLGANDGFPFELDIIGGLSAQVDGRKAKEKLHSESNPETRAAIWRILHQVWEHREVAATSPDLYADRFRDLVPEMSRGCSPGRWNLGAWISKDQGLRDLWKAVSSEPFDQAQDLQRAVLERIGKKKRVQKMDDERRRHALGNAVVPNAAQLVARAIVSSQFPRNENP